MNIKNRKEVWTRYWNRNISSSCTDMIQSEDSEINSFWETCSKAIDSESHILDLCTGSGALISELAKLQIDRKEKLSNYYGIDLSQIKPVKVISEIEKHKGNVNFYMDTSVDNLPIKNACIDVVISQFGIEYALSEESFKEISRVLKPSGSFYAVMHHSESILSSIAKEEYKHIEFLLGESGFIITIEKLIPTFALLRNPANAAKLQSDEDANNNRNQFNQITHKINRLMAQSTCPDILKEALMISQSIFHEAKQQGKKASQKLLENYVTELNDYKVRTEELIDIALDANAIDGFIDEFKKHADIESDYQALYSKKRIVGWGLTLKKVNRK